MKKNVLKRNSKTFIFTALLDSNVWKAGDTIKVTKKDGWYQGLNCNTLQTFQILAAHMRNENLLKLDLQYEY